MEDDCNVIDAKKTSTVSSDGLLTGTINPSDHERQTELNYRGDCVYGFDQTAFAAISRVNNTSPSLCPSLWTIKTIRRDYC